MLDKNKIDYYRRSGLKITPQRLAILEYLEGNTSHPTAEDIYRHVSKKFPSMSFATVYNTLEALKEKGLITELHIEGGKKRFDPNPQPHHHFICTKCGKIIDICKSLDLKIQNFDQMDLIIEKFQIFFYGRCSKCK